MKEEKKTKKNNKKVETKISRKAAITRLGLTAFSAATMLLLLNEPAKSQGGSPVTPPTW
jgi:hypothetical protein